MELDDGDKKALHSLLSAVGGLTVSVDTLNRSYAADSAKSDTFRKGVYAVIEEGRAVKKDVDALKLQKATLEIRVNNLETWRTWLLGGVTALTTVAGSVLGFVVLKFDFLLSILSSYHKGP